MPSAARVLDRKTLQVRTLPAPIGTSTSYSQSISGFGPTSLHCGWKSRPLRMARRSIGQAALTVLNVSDIGDFLVFSRQAIPRPSIRSHQDADKLRILMPRRRRGGIPCQSTWRSDMTRTCHAPYHAPNCAGASLMQVSMAWTFSVRCRSTWVTSQSGTDQPSRDGQTCWRVAVLAA